MTATPTHVHTAMTDIPDATQPPAAAEAAAAQPTKSWTANALVAALTAAVTVTVGALGAMLVYEFNSIDDRFASLEADMDERFDSLEAGQAEIARTLTALVAELNAREAVEAALAGRLLTPDPAVAAEPPSAEP